ncbi:hypothetical protein LPJ53_004955 [Coemansia erecta]|uniref:type I protein arginine methyltransferase n=1 Tax=Coemansia erecta TaxID=147472 RepID=A0A9W7XTD2_9FUNG|nr:hypothetical protein LPJ53_004955 [Coemansia erecta]
MSIVSYSESGWDTQEERWDDWEDDEMNAEMKCLFCAHTAQNPSVLFEHVKQTHGFDFAKTRRQLQLDFYQSMRVVNYIRTMGLNEPGFGTTAAFEVDGTEAFLNDDQYLKPAMEDDALLYALDELDLDDGDGSDHEKEPVATTALTSESDLAARVRALEQQLAQQTCETQAVVEEFGEYRQMVRRQFYEGLDDAAATTTTADAGQTEVCSSDYYFNSYAGNDIHMQMLQDRVRTEGYRDFMYNSADVLRGKVILDVGCGTGILSMFAARAGAARVIAVDNSDIIEKARANVIENGLDGVITLVRGRIEDLELPVDHVDVIVSEWMGYFLLFEAMLDSVLVARDRFLAPGGLLAPSASYVYLTAISDAVYMRERVNYWDDVYGFRMSAMKPPVSDGVREADVDVVPPETVAATRALLTAIDHGTATAASLDFASDFAIEATRDAQLHALLGYFDVAFSRTQDAPGPGDAQLAASVYGGTGDSTHAVPEPASLWHHPESPMAGFTTGPHGEATHWKQTIFVLDEPIDARCGDMIRGRFVCHKSRTNPRELDLEISYCHVAAADKEAVVAGTAPLPAMKQQKYQLQ